MKRVEGGLRRLEGRKSLWFESIVNLQWVDTVKDDLTLSFGGLETLTFS